jgi:predicted ATPase
MGITALSVSGYRSIRDISLSLDRLNIVTGANGCGKSNLYRSVYLLHQAAAGRFARTLADEGGLPSVLWAGPRKGLRKTEPQRLNFSVSFEDGLTYSLVAGLPEKDALLTFSFFFDPVIKEENVTFRDGRSSVTLMERGHSSAMCRDADGRRVEFPMSLSRGESALTQLSEPHRFPHLSILRERFLQWRFYHAFATDERSPIRQPQIGVFTPVLSHDGTDLAAALQTIIEIGDADELHRAIHDGLEGARLSVLFPNPHGNTETRFRLQLQTPGIQRPLEAWELSDGTLRYLCLLAALLSPRPPALLALNEPETSLHPNLLPPLAERIVAASRRSQLWITTHSRILADEIERETGVSSLRLTRENGETVVG